MLYLTTMIKKINVDQLVAGMYIHELCGSWLEHPFWRTSFVVSDSGDIDAIRSSSIREVWIDCSKGLDVALEGPVAAQANERRTADRLPASAVPSVPGRPAASVEIERAAKICLQSKQAVKSMFEEVRMGNSVDLGGARSLVLEVMDSVTRNPVTLISRARLKSADDYTYMHSVSVCALMIALAQQLQLDAAQTRSAGLAGLMHDLGKALIPTELLRKPSSLTEREFALIQQHSVQGHRLLQSSGNVDPIALDVCLHHHEKLNGTGYPQGSRNDEISVFAKMGSVCDVYDAMTSNRPYKSGWDPSEAMHRMAELSSAHFEPRIFQALVKCVGIYPVGSLVQLTSGRVGVVVEQTAVSLTKPKVKVFFSTKANMRIAPLVIDLSLPGSSERIATREDPAHWKFKDLNELWSGLAGL